jgi:hypothetical protein
MGLRRKWLFVLLVIIGSSLNIFYEGEELSEHQTVSGSSRDGWTRETGRLLSNPTSVSLSLRFEIFAGPESSATIFTTCPDHFNSLEVTLDMYRNVYATFGLRSSDGERQVVRVMEAASAEITHEVNIKLDLERQTGEVLADGVAIAFAETRPGRNLDLARGQISVCSPDSWPSPKSDDFDGSVSHMHMLLTRQPESTSLRSLNAFLLLVGLGIMCSFADPKKDHQRNNQQEDPN